MQIGKAVVVDSANIDFAINRIQEFISQDREKGLEWKSVFGKLEQDELWSSDHCLRTHLNGSLSVAASTDGYLINLKMTDLQDFINVFFFGSNKEFLKSRPKGIDLSKNEGSLFSIKEGDSLFFGEGFILFVPQKKNRHLKGCVIKNIHLSMLVAA